MSGFMNYSQLRIQRHARKTRKATEQMAAMPANQARFNTWQATDHNTDAYQAGFAAGWSQGWQAGHQAALAAAKGAAAVTS